MSRWLAILICGQLLAGTVELRGQDADALHREGSAARRAGRLVEAIDRLTAAAKLRPDDADIQVDLGLALSPLKRYGEAEKAFRRALEIAPDHLDATLGLARLAYFRQQFVKARAGVRTVLAKLPDNADARELDGQIKRAINARAAARKEAAEKKEKEEKDAREVAAKPTKRWRLDLEGSHSRLTGGREDWVEGGVRLRYSLAPETAVSGAVETARRFGVVDTFYEARFEHEFSPLLSGHLFIGVTPNAHFLPKLAVGGRAAATVQKGEGVLSATVLTIDARHAEYVSGAVETIAPGFEQYLFDGKFWLTARWINTFVERDGRLPGYLVRADLMMSDALRVFLGYTDAPETSEGVAVQMRSLFGGLVYEASASTTLRASLAREKRPDLYERTVTSLGMSYKF